MAPKKKTALPSVGDAFAVPLEDGRYSVCRVLVDRASRPKLSIDAVRVACSAWTGSEVPSADDPELRPILKLTHHSFKGMPCIVWISDPVPDNFLPIGKIDPTEDEANLDMLSHGAHGDWASMALQPLLQWRWDHDRDAVLAQDAAQRKRQADQAAQDTIRRRGYLTRVTLEELATRAFFPGWEHPPKKAVQASHKIMVDTVRALTDLGKSASEHERLQVLQACIESFNKLDEELEFIETPEREDICREFEAVVHACGLGSHESLADEWRDW